LRHNTGQSCLGSIGDRAPDRSGASWTEALLYEPPFTSIAPTGPEQLFDESKVTRLFTKIKAINDSAMA